MALSYQERTKITLLKLMFDMHEMHFDIYDIVQALQGVQADEVEAVGNFIGRLISDYHANRPEARRARRRMSYKLHKLVSRNAGKTGADKFATGKN